MQLIPAMDLRRGRVVRLIQGDDGRQKDYGLDPWTLLAEYGAAGIERVHVVDLDGAFGETPQRGLIERLTDIGPAIQLGGGLRDAAAVAWALDAGCERVVLGSLAVRDFDAFAAIVERFPDRVAPAVEVAGDELRVAGWREGAAVPVDEHCRRLRGLPCPAVLVTDVERDGTLRGPNLELARNVSRASALPALLSGGVGSAAELRAASAVAEIAGAIVGKALYDRVLTLDAALAACRGEGG